MRYDVQSMLDRRVAWEPVSSRCTACKEPIDGVKVCTEDAGVLCVPCAQESHAIPAPIFRVQRLGRVER